ncbi:L,D-transpeptidase family protein [Mesorhizobium caraganae]|uniref:L,D-transpeptidase family protein n=1 Tax=Mesorhizobium caraganae TaxID=483206 RepID=A0ABV1Z3Z0_9HYPH
MRLTIFWAICIVLPTTFPAFAPERIDLVRVDKSERRLHLIGAGKLLRRYSIALGGDPVGQKGREGDERTPEGRYILDWRNPGSVAYKSIHISYPNAAQVEAANAAGIDPGGNIMIHGQPNGFGWSGWLLQLVDWTDGCIGVTDSDMDEIWTMVPDGTPIEIEP